MKNFFISLALALPTLAVAQTDVSLGWRSDSLQVSQISSETADQYKKVLHHGPAVENQFMAVRIYFNNSGAIDVYSKADAGLELAKYRWYPSKAAIADGAGCDEYRVGKTIGLGGISLWNGEAEVKLVATRGRVASAEHIKGGAKISMLSKGVPYKGDTIDVLVSVIARDNERWMTVEAKCVSGQKVQFLTGVNYHNGQTEEIDDESLAVWGVHPADVVENPLPIGGGMRYKAKRFVGSDKTDNLLRLISKPTKCVSTKIIAACSKEPIINNQKAFFDLVKE